MQNAALLAAYGGGGGGRGRCCADFDLMLSLSHFLCHFIPVQVAAGAEVSTNQRYSKQECLVKRSGKVDAPEIYSYIGSSMVLYMIGLGLGDADDITVKGLKVRK
jgi:hypothetical protein